MKFSTFERKCTLIVSRLKKIKGHLEGLLSENISSDTVHELSFYAQESRDKYTDFKNYYSKLSMCDTVTDYDEDKALDLEESVSSIFLTIEVLLKPHLGEISKLKHEESCSSASNLASTNLKLPPLSLKTFNGSPNLWVSFFSLFEASVNNNSSLTETEKFQYLVSCLQNEPLNLIKNLPITSENYEVAWNILKQRYQNSRKIITYHANNIIDLPNVSNQSPKHLRSFITGYQENMQALLALKFDVKKNSLILVTLILRKLDGDLRKKFEDGRGDAQKMPDIQEIITFLENECVHMEAADLSHKPSNFATRPNSNMKQSLQNVAKPSRTVLIASSSKPSVVCKFCGKSNHSVYRCTEFHALSPRNKIDFVKKNQYCFNCLGTAHTIKNCKSKNVCSHCGKKHHSWLHLSNSTSPSVPTQYSANREPHPGPSQLSKTVLTTSNDVVALSQNRKPHTTVLLGTALVLVSAMNGTSLVFRAVVDSASMITCISENAARLLSLTRYFDQRNTVDGLSSCEIKTKGVSSINISNLSGNQVARNHPVVILDKITSNLPHTHVPDEIKEKFKNLVLADPTFNLPSPVDLLIGADLFVKIITGERVVFKDNFPSALNSVFGYLIIGATPALQPSPGSDCTGITTLLSTNDMCLHQSLQRFWTQEELPQKLQVSPDEEFCEQHYSAHYKRDSTGRYIVSLPFKDGHPPLGNSEDNAKRRFLALERRLNADPELKNKYIECINDYLQSGHMKLVTEPIPEESKHFFLPHHGVIKEESSTTKLRVVFDASAKTSTGISLNQILHCGQKLQNEICDILVNFRCYPIVFSCDIRKMFRQIKVNPDDQNYQLLFWREDSSHPLLIYKLTTVVFGFSCSPYLAIRTLRQLVVDEGDKYPLASQALMNQVYVDDLILGANSIVEALSLQKEIIELLSQGGFDLRKWTSNCLELVCCVPESHREKPLLFESSENPIYSVLGIKWLAEPDQFAYHLQIPTKVPTKRNILSTVARIYDVCGWLTPVIFWTKSLLQLLWTLGLQWDEPVPHDVSEKWNKFLSQLPDLNNIRIPRYVAVQPASEIQLHGFSDGSEAGYSAVVYLRCSSVDNIHVCLLLAKSRVAPLQRISVPRLELCGAHLLAGLLQYAVKLISQHFRISSITAWCDSSVVLSWIHTPPYRLKVYVANRVAQIQDMTPSHQWNHISSHFNPADCASRGILPSSLHDHPLWWQGPPWLRQPQDTWPVPCFTPVQNEDLPETKTEPLRIMVATETSDKDIFNRFSSWSMLLRVVAYIIRFIRNIQGRSKNFGFLTTTEINHAKVKICGFVQRLAFQEDLARLKSDKPCTSQLIHLSPFLDEDSLIRVGGRIKNSTLSYSAKHPIVLPKGSHVTNLIIDFYHKKYLHAGPHFLQANISQQFWILSARRVIRSRISKCIRCFRCQPTVVTQKMGDLPSPRVTPSRVFYNCGSDFLGPFLIKANLLRKAAPVKAYICVFICFSVKAVHLEVVTSLSAEAFIAALTRFVSRRGLSANIYCDCGTNYVGASSDLQKSVKEFFKQENTKSALDSFAQQNEIKFHFLPPAAPHQGGLWERAVRSIKYHFRRVVGDQILSLEEFITLSTRVESILNSRPLTPLSSDPTELDCLTPGHFLIGGPLVAPPEPGWKDVPYNRLSRWQLVQALTQSLWKRWSQEYLHTLQQRSKWSRRQENVKIGDLVLLHEPNAPPLSWRLGRITSVSPGADGLIRVVHLHTSKGTLSRPITKISPLPIED